MILKPVFFIQLLLCPVFFLVYARVSEGASLPALKHKTLQDVVISNLAFVASEQIAKTNAVYVAGEWPTSIESSLVPVAVGVGRALGKNEEASAFTTASVANQLASLYLHHPEVRHLDQVKAIPKLIEKGIVSYDRYREGYAYNFYPPKVWNGKRVRQPIDMTLFRIWKGFTNIPEDADTSSSVYASLLYYAQIQQRPLELPAEILEMMSAVRDVNRSPHYYNRFEGRRNTGAFMTWLTDENSQHLQKFWFASPDRGTRIPFNRNDVDCVVNLNVLKMLALAGKDMAGRKEACALINDMIRKSEHASCGIYYPNTFNMAFAAAETQRAGETCFEEDRKKQLVEYILHNTTADGGWDNVNNVWNDRLQSTIYAMTALLEFGDPKDRRVEISLIYGTSFLLRNMKVSASGDLYLPGEVFFTATAIARSLVVWRSNSYATTIAAAILLEMQKRYPNHPTPYYTQWK